MKLYFVVLAVLACVLINNNGEVEATGAGVALVALAGIESTGLGLNATTGIQKSKKKISSFFSCEGVAQQVQFSLCLSVCVFQN